MAKPKRLKRCKNPGCPLPDRKFLPDRPMQDCCSVTCAIAYIPIKERELAEKRARKQKADKNKNDLSHQLELTQKAFNQFIVTLDKALGFKCASCDRPRCGTYNDCGHFLSVGAFPELRFDPRNAHLQGSGCNRNERRRSSKERQIKETYTQTLVDRYGQPLVDYLEGPHKARHYICPELIKLRAVFNAEKRLIEKTGFPSVNWRALGYTLSNEGEILWN